MQSEALEALSSSAEMLVVAGQQCACGGQIQRFVERGRGEQADLGHEEEEEATQSQLLWESHRGNWKVSLITHSLLLSPLSVSIYSVDSTLY